MMCAPSAWSKYTAPRATKTKRPSSMRYIMGSPCAVATSASGNADAGEGATGAETAVAAASGNELAAALGAVAAEDTALLEHAHANASTNGVASAFPSIMVRTTSHITTCARIPHASKSAARTSGDGGRTREGRVAPQWEQFRSSRPGAPLAPLGLR